MASTVVLDLEGSDLGAEEMLRGARQSQEALKADFLLRLVTTQPESFEQYVKTKFPRPDLVQFVRAEQAYAKEVPSPVKTFRELPECSINVGMRMIKDKSDHVFISPGNTGLVMTSALFTLGRFKSIERSPVGVAFPTAKNIPVFMLDAGSNVDVRSEHMHQFARLGSTFVSQVWGRPRPKVALLSNGAEAYKGTEAVREASKLISQDPSVNYVGLVEGQNMFDGNVDVIVCDGFVGNLVLKALEGFSGHLTRYLRSELSRNPWVVMMAWAALKKIFHRIKKSLDYTEYGGAPLLGVNGYVVICHGRSNSNAIKNAIREGLRLVESRFLGKLAENSQPNSKAN